MEAASWVASYIIIWWLVFFMVLPWGNQLPEKIIPGWATSAPAKPRLFIKVLLTSFVALILCSILRIFKGYFLFN